MAGVGKRSWLRGTRRARGIVQMMAFWVFDLLLIWAGRTRNEE